MTCESASRYFSSLLYGELTFEEEENLRQHLETCGRCQDDFEREQRLHQALDRYQAEIPGTLLAECRRSLREEIGELRNHKRSLFSRLGEFVSLGPWTRPLGALALIAIGFFAARLTEPGTGPDPAPIPVEAAAYRVRTIEPKPSGRVELVVDETRQRVLSGGLDDDRIREFLLMAAGNSADPGIRVESIEVLKERSGSDDVRDALLSAVRHDANVGVRLKAIEGLRPYADHPDTRKALAQVLLTDNNPGVRAQAIDLLVQNRELDVINVLQQLVRTEEENSYIRMRSQKALREMNASVGTF